jgi:hypothetical protein
VGEHQAVAVKSGVNRPIQFHQPRLELSIYPVNKIKYSNIQQGLPDNVILFDQH